MQIILILLVLPKYQELLRHVMIPYLKEVTIYKPDLLVKQSSQSPKQLILKFNIDVQIRNQTLVLVFLQILVLMKFTLRYLSKIYPLLVVLVVVQTLQVLLLLGVVHSQVFLVNINFVMVLRHKQQNFRQLLVLMFLI